MKDNTIPSLADAQQACVTMPSSDINTQTPTSDVRIWRQLQSTGHPRELSTCKGFLYTDQLLVDTYLQNRDFASLFQNSDSRTRGPLLVVRQLHASGRHHRSRYCRQLGDHHSCEARRAHHRPSHRQSSATPRKSPRAEIQMQVLEVRKSY